MSEALTTRRPYVGFLAVGAVYGTVIAWLVIDHWMVRHATVWHPLSWAETWMIGGTALGAVIGLAVGIVLDAIANRRRFRFSLRTLFVVVAVVGLASAIVTPLARQYVEWRRAHQYDELIELIQTTVKPT